MFRRTLITAAGAAALVAATLAPAQAATYAVTLSAPSTADSGALFKVTGKVTGKGYSKKALKIQRKIGSGPWKTYSTVTTTKTGAFTRSVKMASLGEKKFRVVAPAQGAVKQGISPTRTVTGFTWLPLVTQPHLSGGYQNWDVTAKVSGTSFKRSVLYANAGTGSNAFNYYNVDGRCNKVSFGLGIDDRSGSEDGVPFTVAGFSDPGGLTQTYTSGSSVTTSLKKYQENVAPTIQTLIFSATVESGTVVAITTPKVHCSVSKLPPMPLIG